MSCIRHYLKNLTNDNILVKIGEEYVINDMFEVIRKLIQKYSKIQLNVNIPTVSFDRNVYEIGSSNYYKKNLENFVKKLVNYLNFVNISENDRNVLIKILKISPSAICYCFGIEDRIWEKNQKKIIDLFQILLNLLMIDILSNKFNLFQNLDDDNKLIYFNPSLVIKFLLKKEVFLELNLPPQHIMFARLKDGHDIGLRGDAVISADDLIVNQMGGFLVQCNEIEEAMNLFNRSWLNVTSMPARIVENAHL
ncbi:MAG: hypothetical protein ACFFCS_06355, partial [Candidatus Hodarchaeota archaeon]